MAVSTTARRWASVLAVVGIILVGLSLRTVITSVSPLLKRIAIEVPLDPVVLGVIAAAPTIAFAASGIFTPSLARRLGIERTLVMVLAIMSLGLAARAVAPTATIVVAATLVTLVGSGVANVLVPPLVKRYFPHRIGAVTAVYVATLAVSGALPALVAVPLAEAAGWRVALGVWALGALVAALPWIVVPRVFRVESASSPLPDALPPASARTSPLTRSGVAWSLVGLFAMCSFGGFAMMAWLPTILVETAGLDAASAGALLSLFTVCGLPIAIAVPPLAARRPALIVPIIAIGMLSFVVGYGGLLFAPELAPVAWVLALGLGALPYPLCFTLIGLRTRSAHVALSLSGFVQAVGYVIASIGPFTVGILHEVSGGWAWPLGFLMGASLFGLPGLFLLGRHRFVEDELTESDRRTRRSRRTISARRADPSA